MPCEFSQGIFLRLFHEILTYSSLMFTKNNLPLKEELI